MRTLSIICAAMALLAGSATAQQAPRHTTKAPAPARCAPTAGIADYRGEAPRVRKLGEMPPANQIYAVFSVVDGCPQPVVVRKGIGGNLQQQASPTRSPPRATRSN